MIQLAVSLGGVQSLIEIAGSMTHPEKYISASERKEGGLSESLVRFRYALIVVLVTLLVRPCIEMTYRNDVLFYCWFTHPWLYPWSFKTFVHWVSDAVLRTHLLDFAPAFRYHFKTIVQEGFFQGYANQAKYCWWTASLHRDWRRFPSTRSRLSRFPREGCVHIGHV